MENDENLNQEALPGDTKPGSDQFSGGKDENGHEVKSTADIVKEKKGSMNFLRYLLIVFVLILTFVLLVVFIIYLAPGLQEVSSVGKSDISANSELKKDAGYKNQISLMSKDIQRLSRKYSTYTTGQSYIVINTTDNRFSLYKNKVLVREGICSSGAVSYTHLTLPTILRV